MSTVFVIGADRGFAKFGYAIFRLTPEGEEVKEVHVIETKKDSKKKGTLAASDNHRRTHEIYVALNDIFVMFEIMAAGAEATSLPRNSSSSYKIGLGEGAWIAVLGRYQVPQVEASPQAIKKKLCGNSSASKKMVQEALESRYPGQFNKFKEKYPAGKWEHGFDAAGAVVACLESDVFKMARQMAAR